TMAGEILSWAGTMHLNWERTPLACGLRRHAANFQPTDFSTPNRGPIMEHKTDGVTPSVARGTRALPNPSYIVPVQTGSMGQTTGKSPLFVPTLTGFWQCPNLPFS